MVNKFWNYEARCVLRDKKKCVAVIDGDHPCVNAKKLNETVGSLNLKFFNGLSLTRKRRSGQSECLLTSEKVEEAYENLLRMPWKYLETDWTGCMTEDCVLGQFILRLMSRSLTLEHVIMKYVPEKFKLKEENRPQEEFELPKLKTIEFSEHSIKSCPALLPTLLARARNVEELHTVFSPTSIPSLPTDALKMVKKLRFPSYIFVFLHAYEETMRSLNILGASEAKLSTVIAEGQFFLHGNNQMIHDYCHRLISIISSHSETLRELKIDSWTIYCSVLANHFPQVLKNVENLTFEIYQGADPGIARYLLKLPLAQIFPNVKSVKFSASGSQQRYMEIENDGMLPWPAVKEVKFEDLVCSDRMVEEIGLLFPNLCCLEISFLDEDSASPSSFPFRKIWSTLPFLEKLTVRGKLAKVEQNFDAEFCGIHPEEAADLQTKDDEFLKAVNIVPPFPPITHMKSECTIRILMRPSCCFT